MGIKNDIALALTIADLTQKRYSTFLPTINGDKPFQIMAYQDKECYRICCRHSIDGFIPPIENDEFDYYALYLPDVDKIVYPSVDFGGEFIRTKPDWSNPYYYYEDFTSDLTDEAVKKTQAITYSSMSMYNSSVIDTDSIKIMARTIDYHPRYKSRKVERPSKPILENLVEELGFKGVGDAYGVSDNAVRKWLKTPDEILEDDTEESK